jgi:hypothetical protein
MKGRPLLCVCLFAGAHAHANNIEAHTPPAAVSFAMNSIGATAKDYPTPIAGGARINDRTPADFVEMGGTLVNQARRTAAFAEKKTVTEGIADGWLIALAAVGLIALQLRRKHNSLPQRRIAPYG